MVARLKPETERLAERLAFNDPDRKTPVHDDICLWLDAKLREEDPAWLADLAEGGLRAWNAGRVHEFMAEAELCRQRQMKDAQIEIEQCDGATKQDDYWVRRRAQAEQKLAGCLKDFTDPPPPYAPPAVGEIVWELAIGDERWTSGFIDVFAEVTITSGLELSHGMRQSSTYEHRCGTWEPKWVVTGRSVKFAFEVKSTIPSLGELIRQVRYYESKFPARYFVVAPDETHRTMLKSQGIGFITYPHGAISRP